MVTPRLLWLSKETPDRIGQGGQRRQYFQIRELAAAGIEVTVMTPAGDQDDASIRELADVVRFSRRRLTGRSRPDPVGAATSSRFDRIIVAHAESYDLLNGRAADVKVPWLVD